MKTLEQYYEEMTTKELVEERLQIQIDIENNDGRLTTHSSADLDYSLDKQEIIDNILLDRRK